jgi:co-chaperonin GroES (HSP10)
MAVIEELLRDARTVIHTSSDDKVKFRPVLDRILVEELPVEENRIHLPGQKEMIHRSERFLKKSDLARVLAVGDGVPMGGILMPMPYQVGQVVKCSEYGRKYVLLDPADELGTAKGEIPKRYLIRVADTDGEKL